MWLIGVIATCASVGYKGVDCHSGYYYDVLGMNEAHVAGLTASASYIRLVAALGPDSWGIGSESPGWSGFPLERWQPAGQFWNFSIWALKS